MKGKEIEVKFKITTKQKQQIIKDLKNIGKFEKTSHLIDTYYIPYYKDFELNGETIECLRIREDKKGIVLAYKKIHKEHTPVYCDEFETSIENKENLEKILFAIGFSVQMIIDKTRESYSYQNFEFDFDSVKNLGEFMEIEWKNTELENADTSKIFDFVKKYGVSEKDVCTTGIQTLMKQSQQQKIS